MLALAERPDPSTRPADPLVACIGQMAERHGVAFAPGMLTGLARTATGRLPRHQAEAALELIGLNCELDQVEKLPALATFYPAIVEMAGGDFVVIHEVRDGDALVWRPRTGSGVGKA